MKKYPNSSANKPMKIYAIGDSKYAFTSLCAIARMLFMRSLRGSRRCGGFVGRQVQEDLFEAHAHRAQLQEPPASRHHGGGEIAADVPAALAFDFDGDDAAT